MERMVFRCAWNKTVILVGHIKSDAEQLGRGGWLIGSFFPEDGEGSERRLDEIEVKYWEFLPGQESGHARKKSATVEWTLILSGSTLALLGENEQMVLNAGDYIVIHPGTPNNLVHKVLERVIGITVIIPKRSDIQDSVSPFDRLIPSPTLNTLNN